MEPLDELLMQAVITTRKGLCSCKSGKSYEDCCWEATVFRDSSKMVEENLFQIKSAYVKAVIGGVQNPVVLVFDVNDPIGRAIATRLRMKIDLNSCIEKVTPQIHAICAEHTDLKPLLLAGRILWLVDPPKRSSLVVVVASAWGWTVHRDKKSFKVESG